VRLRSAARFDVVTDTTIPGAVERPAPPAPRGRRPGGRAVGIGVWVPVAGFAIWAAVRVLGWERGFPAVQLIAFTPYVAGAAVLVPPLALLLRRWPAAAVAALVATALLACVVPRWSADGGPLPTGPALRVMTANMLVGTADPAAIVALVRAERVDLLALQEFTPQARDALAGAGLDALLPNRSTHPADGVGGSALYSRFPLRDDGLRLNPEEFGQAKATVTVAGAAAFAVESVHTCAPSDPSRSACWAGSFGNEPPATVRGQVRLMIGDFNATLDHAALRGMLATGYRDAADVVGAGLDPTWPYDKLFPRVTLDHVLADRRVGVRRVAVHPLPGSDHRAVFAELVLPAG
jgi:endonuclease/exonuclease/phosphatase (EEP) superfamily protein YafD